MQAVHGPSAGRSAGVLPAALDSAIALHSSTLPQLHGYTDSLDSSSGDGAISAADAAASAAAAAPIVAGQLLPAVAVQGQQLQLRDVTVPAADGATAVDIPQQQRPFAKKAAAESSDASKAAAYEALWQWAANVTGMVSCHICFAANME